jgi:hypothetical protein
MTHAAPPAAASEHAATSITEITRWKPRFWSQSTGGVQIIPSKLAKASGMKTSRARYITAITAATTKIARRDVSPVRVDGELRTLDNLVNPSILSCRYAKNYRSRLRRL